MNKNEYYFFNLLKSKRAFHTVIRATINTVGSTNLHDYVTDYQQRTQILFPAISV